MANIAENIRALRAQRGMSQAELAERIGRKRSAVGNYESGVREPDLDTLRALAEALNVSVSELIGGDAADPRPAAELDPARRRLLELARNGSQRDVDQAVAILDALKRTNPDFYDGEGRS